MSSVTSHAGSCICSSSALPACFSCFSVLPTLPFQTLHSNLRILKQIPCSFFSNIYSHFSFSHPIANPISTRDFVEICLFSFFRGSGNFKRKVADNVRKNISLLSPADTEVYLVFIILSCLLPRQSEHNVFLTSNLF